jgi:hypothetical protein
MTNPTRFIFITAAGLLTLSGLACAADDTSSASDPTSNEVETDSGNDDNPPPADLNPDLMCRIETGTGPTASGTLTNHSSGLSGYMISVSFLDAGGTRVADGTAFVNNVQAGQTTTWSAPSFAFDADFATCEVVSVERLAQ